MIRWLVCCAVVLLVSGLAGNGFGGGIDPLGKVEMYLSQGRSDLAFALLDDIIAANPERVDAYTSRAFVNLKFNRHREAISDFTTVIMLQPKHPNAYLSRGMVYDQLKEYDLAAVDFRKACELGDKSGCSFQEQLSVRGRK